MWEIKTGSYNCDDIQIYEYSNNKYYNLCRNKLNKGPGFRFSHFKNYPKCLEENCPLKVDLNDYIAQG